MAGLPQGSRRHHSFVRINPYFENDFFASQDRYYTVGWKIATVFSNTQRDVTQNSLSAIDSAKSCYLSLSIGQQVYTPTDQQAVELVQDDRPYAGWLYVASAWHKLNENTKRSMQVQIGIVGPSAGGEQLMNLFHALIHNDPVRGWHNQLADEIGVLAGYEKKWRFRTTNLPIHMQGDLIPHAGVALGNVHTFANAGAQLLMGWNVPGDFGVSRIRPSAESGLETYSTETHSDWKFYVYLGLDARFVIRNIFLDGNTFKASHSVAKSPVVAFFSAGWVVRYRRFQFMYSHIATTKEFKTQNDMHQYASLVFSWLF